MSRVPLGLPCEFCPQRHDLGLQHFVFALFAYQDKNDWCQPQPLRDNLAAPAHSDNRACYRCVGSSAPFPTLSPAPRSRGSASCLNSHPDRPQVAAATTSVLFEQAYQLRVAGGLASAVGVGDGTSVERTYSTGAQSADPSAPITLHKAAPQIGRISSRTRSLATK